MLRILRPAAAACGLSLAIPALACTGTVTIGEGADLVSTSVANKSIAGR